MDDIRNDLPEKSPAEESTPKLRGLYRYVNISVKTLDWIIVACIALILVVVILEIPNFGFTVTFDSNGGTDVPAQTYMYGELLQPPEPPTREGYTFTGWYKDYACDEAWNLESDIIEQDTILFAGWEKIE